MKKQWLPIDWYVLNSPVDDDINVNPIVLDHRERVSRRKMRRKGQTANNINPHAHHWKNRRGKR